MQCFGRGGETDSTELEHSLSSASALVPQITFLPLPAACKDNTVLRLHTRSLKLVAAAAVVDVLSVSPACPTPRLCAKSIRPVNPKSLELQIMSPGRH